MFQKQLDRDLKATVKKLGFITPTDTVIYIQENPKFGDYSSNIALQLSKQKHQNTYQTALEIANAILEQFGHPDYLESISIAGPGFLNFTLKDKSLLTQLTDPKLLKAGTKTGKKYLVEYGDPNTHKLLHIGHLVPLILGESFSRLLEYKGGEVTRVNYGSDIGLTVGKCLWGIEKLDSVYTRVKEESTLRQKAEFLGQSYSYAHKFYTEDPEAKKEIDELTKKIYLRDISILPLWEETTKWSLAYFDSVYSILGIEFDRRINESEVEAIGKELVLKNVGKVFKEDQGAIIFPGEEYGLHTRVFINSAGNPLYEAKDLGLTEKYFELNHFDELFSLSHKEQNDYFRVVLKAIELVFGPEGKKRKHLSFGELRLSTGKMSSREGNVVGIEEMIDTVTQKLEEIAPQLPKENIRKIATGGIKFWLLKYSINSDILFDIEKSVSLNGDSGPYVMYVYARITSLLNRAKDSEAIKKPAQAQKEIIAQSSDGERSRTTLEDSERLLLRQLDYFDIVAKKAAENLQPNELTSYLLDLSKAFNLFYEKCPILGSDKQSLRIEIIKRVGETIQLGLYLLGIETVDRM